MAGKSEQIDAISVAVGLTLSRIPDDVRRMGKMIRATAESNDQNRVYIPVRLGWHENNSTALPQELRRFRRSTETFLKAGGEKEQIHVPIKLIADDKTLKEFRTRIEKRLQGTDQQGIRIPIQVANLSAFRRSIQAEFTDKPIYVEVRGYVRKDHVPGDPRSGPGSGPVGGGGGGGGGAPRGGGGPRPATGGGRATPPPQKPAQGRASVPPVIITPASGGPATFEERHAQAEAEEAAARQEAIDRYNARTTGGAPAGAPAGAPPINPKRAARQARAAESRTTRRESRAAQGVAQPNRRPRAERTFGTPDMDYTYTDVPEGVTDRMDIGQARRSAGRRSASGKTYVPPVKNPQRMSTNDVSPGRPEDELQGDERAAFVGQQRARPGRVGPVEGDTAPAYQGEFRATAAGGEAMAQAAHRREAAARAASPASEAARGHYATGLESLHPALGNLYKLINDPRNPPTLESLSTAIGEADDAYQDVVQAGRQSGKVRRGIRRVRSGGRKADPNDPVVVQYLTALDAARELQRRLINTTHVIKTADQANRTRRGSPGRMSGFTAGTLKSQEGIDPGLLRSIQSRRATGGRGNGWKTLISENPDNLATVRWAQSLERDARATPGSGVEMFEDPTTGRFGARAIDELEPGAVYGGGAEMAAQGEGLGVQGGGGVTRKDRIQLSAEASQARANAEAARKAAAAAGISEGPGPGFVPPAEPVRAAPVYGRGKARRQSFPGFGVGQEEVTGRRTTGATEEFEAGHGRVRHNPPPQTFGVPHPRAQQAAEEAEIGRRGAEEAFGGAFQGAFRGQYRQAYHRAGGDEGEEPIVQGYSNRRVRALLAMAKAEETPHEMAQAQAVLKRMGITKFADGGVMFAREGRVIGRGRWEKVAGMEIPRTGPIPGHIIAQAYPALKGDMPRLGSHERAEIERAFRDGVRNRRKQEKKPGYMREGPTGLYRQRRAEFLELTGKTDPLFRCSYCGQPTIEGDRGPRGRTVDHSWDTASGGDVYDLKNFSVMDNQHNGLKAGGKSARKLPKLAEGGGLWERIQMAAQTGSPIRGVGGFGPNPTGGRMGGGIYKAGGLLQSARDKSVTMVGERGPELVVSDRNGNSEVVPSHKVSSYLGSQGMPQGRAEGGALAVVRRGQNLQYAAGGGLINEVNARVGPVTRVFVVNWPPAIQHPQGQGQGQTPASSQAQAPNQQQTPNQQQQPPGAPNNATPPGSTTTRLPKNPDADAEARRQARANADVVGFQERISASRSDISTALQEAPVRALSVAFGQISQTMIGGRKGILERSRQATEAAGTAGSEATQLASYHQSRINEQTKLQGLQIAGAPQEQIAESIRQIAEWDKTIDKQTKTTERATRETEVRTKGKSETPGTHPITGAPLAENEYVDKQGAVQKSSGILTRPQQARAQVAGLGGILVGTQLFSAAMMVFAGAEKAAAAALGPLVDQMLGFPAAIDKVTVSVRDSIQQMGPDVRAGTAAALAPSGVSAAYLQSQGGALAASGAARAAEQNAQVGLDVTRASAGAKFGGEPAKGLYRGTGGIFGSQYLTELFGGQPGLLETMQKRLEVNGPNPLQRAIGTAGNMIEGSPLNTTGPANRGFLGMFQNDRSLYEDAKQRLQMDKVAPRGPFSFRGDTEYDRKFVARFEASLHVAEDQADVLKDLNKQLTNAATYAGDAGKAFKLVANAAPDLTDAMLTSAAAAEAAGDAGATERAKGYAAAHVTVVGPGGRALQGAEFGSQGYGAQAVQGAIMKDPKALLDAMAPAIRTQVAMIRAQSAAAQTEDIPAAFAEGRIARPPQRYGTTFGVGAAGLQATGGVGSDQTLANIGKYRTLVGGAVQDTQKAEAAGRAALDTIVARSGPDALKQFKDINDQIGSIGSTIKNLQEGLSFRQTTYETKSYNEQLRITTQSLGDAKDFVAGIHGATMDTVGGLEGQNALLARQNELLGRRSQQLGFKSESIGFKSSDLQYQLQQMQFAQTQRQINFAKATSRFSAPGDTPEERFARIEQAKLEAAEAQRQLNLQIRIARLAHEQLSISKQQLALNREQFANQNKSQDNSWKQTILEAQRSVNTLNNSLNLMEEEHSINIDTKAVDETVGKLEEQQGLLMSHAQEYLGEAQNLRGVYLQTVAAIRGATDTGWSEIVGVVNDSWNQMFAGYGSALNTMLGQIGANPIHVTTNRNGETTPNGRGKAEGGIMRTSGATRFIAGEAGTEQVIVLRNPKEGMMSSKSAWANGGGGGGGAQINIYVTGNSVRDDRDLDHLIFRIKREINKDAALIGARRNF